MLKAVFLDLDDTLVVNQVLYDNARYLLAGYLRHMGIPEEDTINAVNKKGAELYKTHGLSRARYPATFEAVLKDFVPNADAEMVEIVRGFAETVFGTVAPVKPGTAEALELLAGHFDVYILTAGDKTVQEARLRHFPFGNFLKDAWIVEKKDRKAFEAHIAKTGLKPSEIVMIGDSLTSDVLPAVEAGMQGILIDAKTWSSYHPAHTGGAALPEEGAYAFSSLLEAARHLSEHGTAASKKFRLARNNPKPKP